MIKKISVVVVMGSVSDLKVMRAATELLEDWGVGVETNILSAHRTPELISSSVSEWQKRGIKVIIAGAGGAAHLPGMIASYSYLPVIGVPIKSAALGGLDALLSVVQMPKGVPVATVGVDNAANGALLTAEIMALDQSEGGAKLKQKILKFKNGMRAQIKTQRKKIKSRSLKQFMKNIK